MDLGPVKTPWEATAQAVVTCGAVGLFLAAALAGLLFGVRLMLWPLVVLAIAASFSSRPLGRRAAFKRLAGLRNIGFRVCPWCSYDLRHLEPAGDCPECGRPFDPETLGREWRDRLEPVARGIRF
jgi:hypothetical protein